MENTPVRSKQHGISEAYGVRSTVQFLLVIMMGGLLGSCNTSPTGTIKENLPPRTSLTVDAIDIDEDNRLSSSVAISWWGDDPDGYIVGYEVAIQDTTAADAWIFTTRTDSTFVLPISEGNETEDVLFAVRAVDNDQQRDPNPATLVFPIKNTPPITELNPLELPPDTTYSVVSFGWSFDDPDGAATLLRTEITFNDSTSGWIPIPLDEEGQQEVFITLVSDNDPVNPRSELFLGRTLRETGIIIETLNSDANNKLFVRTLDKALAISEMQSVSWYMKSRKSNILMLNDDASGSSAENLALYLEQFIQLGFDVDVINISDGTGLEGGVVPISEAFPRVIDPTVNLMMAQWDHIFWFSSSLSRNINYAQEILDRFFARGGTMLATIPVTKIDEESPLFNFIPLQNYMPLNPSAGETSFLLLNNSDVTPVEGSGIELTMRYNGGNNPNIIPFEAVSAAQELFEGNFRKRFITGFTVPFEGPSVVAAENPEGNLIYFGIPLADLNGSGNLNELMEELLIGRLEFASP